jgi:hypothetical protein
VILPLGTCLAGYKNCRMVAPVPARSNVPQPHNAPWTIGERNYARDQQDVFLSLHEDIFP